MKIKEYPKISLGRLEDVGGLKSGFGNVLDVFILKESGKLNRKWVIQLQKSLIQNTDEGKPRSFRSESIIQLKELLHTLIKMFGAWEILGILSPFNDKKIKMEDLNIEIENRWRSLSIDMKSSYRSGFVLGLEDRKVKVI